jgi:hypothetical protein
MSRLLRRVRLSTLIAVVVVCCCAAVALAHDRPRDSNGGHECTQSDVNAGLCEPAGSYHCHTQTCVFPTDKQPTTSGGPTLADLERESGVSGAAQASAAPTAAPTPIATVAPTAVATPPVASPQQALGNTGTFTDVLGWTGLAVLFLGLAFVLFGPPRRRRTTPGANG